uniref:Heat shock protein 70 n=1 Tax=Sweet potato chlorotic stunt virus TaxID=81931 RepID=M1GMT7_9CLOS|nr:heat shock protein 70 [Sweet potato chlorotic stunt virus]
MEAKAGLDFGTTFSTISAYVGGTMKVLRINGSEFIPTCLSITKSGDVIVGGAAQVLDASQLPHCYFYDLKRWVGVDRLSFEEIKRRIAPQYSVKLEGNDVLITGIDKGCTCTYTVKQLILLYVDTLVRLFSNVEKLKILSLNVSVPADYKTKQRMFMKSVCESLGFPLRRIINEPSAAAIYSISKHPGFDYFLVYDFGGGTFDTSLIAKDGKFVTVADTLGDSFLGGRDIDKAILAFITRTNNLVSPLSADSLAAIKEEVNSTGKSSFNVLDTTGNIVFVKFSSEDLDKIVPKFTSKSLKILKAIADRNKITSGALFLVGGSSLLRKVQSDVSNFAKSIGLTPIIDKDLRSAVSYGCSMMHAQEDSGSMIYIDCNSHPLMDISLFANPRVIIRKPMSVPFSYKTTRTIQQHINTAINVYEGSSLFVLDNDWLVSANVNTQDFVQSGQDLSFVYKYNVDGILDLFVRNETTGVESLLPNSFALTEKVNKLDLNLTQLSSVDELATVVSILSHFDSNFSDLLKLVNTPSIFEASCSKFGDLRSLYDRLISFNTNFS